MKPFYLIFIITCTLLLSSPSLAQRDSVTVRVYDGSTVQPAPAVISSFEDKNYVRMNTFLVARGAFVLGYERVLHRKHSLAVDAGFTYRDFLYEFSLDDGMELGSTLEVKLGRYMEVAYKFYPKHYHDFDEVIYISPGFISRSYNIAEDVEYYNSTQYVIKKMDRSYSMKDVYLRLGYVGEGRFIDDLITDAYVGFGLREVTENNYTFIDLQNGGQNLQSSQEIKIVPAIYLGARVGFTF